MAISYVLNPFSGGLDAIDQVTLAAVGSTPNANGAVASGNVLTLEPADGSNPGVLTAIAQTIGGSKTFNALMYANGGIDTSSAATLSIGTLNATTVNIGNASSTVNIMGTVVTEHSTTLNVTNPVITVNTGGATGSGANSGIQIEENSAVTGYAETSADRNSWILKAPNTAGIATITPGASGITLAGNVSGNNTGDQTITLTSDVSGSGTGSFATTIQPNVVTNSKLAQMAAHTYKGNNTGSTANAADITATQLTADLNLFTSSLQGLVPASGGGTSNFLRADGTFAVPPTPLTTKGDLYTYSSTTTRHAAPADYGKLIADSNQTDGWRNAAYTETQAKPGKNYIQYADFENGSTTGWSLGHVSLTSNLPSGTPTFGSGASGNLSIQIITGGAQLAGSNSLELISTAATTAGDFLASNAFTIDKQDQAKVLSFKFYYNVNSGAANVNLSGTSSNSLGVAIYDVTNSAWIIPAGVYNLVQGSGTGIAQGTFQTPINGSQFRIVVYNANATSGAVTLYLDDFYVGPQSMAFGPAMSDWVAYTPTMNYGSGSATNMTVSAKYRRVGDSIQVVGSMLFSAASASFARPIISLPAGLSFDTSKITNTNGAAQIIGSCLALDSGVEGYGISPVRYQTSTQVDLVSNAINSFSGTAYAVASDFTNTAPFTFNSGDSLTFQFEGPIVGWSSNTVMSADTDTRIADWIGYATAGTYATGSVISFTTIKDSHGAFSSNTYTIPVSGDYVFNGNVVSTATPTNAIYVWVNGATKAQFLRFSNTAWGVGSVLVPNLQAGDLITFRPDLSTTLQATGGDFVSIHKLSGPAVVAASESVNARYTIIGNGTLANSTPEVLSSTYATYSQIKDTHAKFSPALGVYSIPLSGTYRASLRITFVNSSASTGGAYASLTQAGSQSVSSESVTPFGAASTGATAVVMDDFNCLEGDTITLGAQQGSGSALAIFNTGTYSSFSIERVGN